MKLTGFKDSSTELSLHVGEEAWRYSHLLKQLPTEVTPATLVPSMEADITFMGGEFHVGTLPQGVQVTSIPAMAAIYASDEMAQLPFAQAKTLSLKITQSLKRPLRLSVARMDASDQATLSGLKIELTSGVKASVLQDCSGGEQGLTIQSFQAHLDETAQLDHVIIVRDGAQAIHVGTFEYRLQQQATLRQTVLNLGAKLSRLQLGVALAGPDAHAHLASLSALTGKAHSDLYSNIRHEVGQTYSSQKAKNFLDGESRGIFTGRIHILPQAQKVEAQQINRNLLLSKKAHALGQPQLEIYADDVKCAHGSTTGQVEEEATFYLESRGISPARVRELLSQGFVQEVFANTQDPEMEQRLLSLFKAGL